MSIYSSKSNLTSILKAYSPAERNKAKNAVINKVRFDMPKQKGLLEAVEDVCTRRDYQQLIRFVEYIREAEFSDAEFLSVFRDARKVVHELSPKFTKLVEALLALSWIKRSPEAVQAYANFCIDVMVAHSRYVQFGLEKLITNWIPAEADNQDWANGAISERVQRELQVVHKLLDGILTAIPMAFNVLLDTIEMKFPYYKRDSYIVAGYVHNILWLMEYRPQVTEVALQLIVQKMLVLDVNAPRQQLEDLDGDSDDDDDDDDNDNEDGEEEKFNDGKDDDEIFEMDDCPSQAKTEVEITPMEHPIARTLDICMEKLFDYIEKKNVTPANASEEEKQRKQLESMKFFKVLLTAFDNVILPSHNTHHVQFLVFYYCTFRQSFMDGFLASLWEKIRNPNVSGVIRQEAIGYLASFLARSKVSVSVLQFYLKELANWCHQYIQGSDQYRTNGSLKANLVFFCVCQAIFYVISFRSRDLTRDKKGILFLQTLQLPALVSCHFNPLRVCLPAVATAFAGVTRAYQLAYCHAILERNARRKLATVYANDTATPEEVLETFFPFDPYLLKMSGRRIAPHYLQYQANEVDIHMTSNTAEDVMQRRRKRGESEMLADDADVDDFLLADKRQRCYDLAKSLEREAQFTYGLSPGFHGMT